MDIKSVFDVFYKEIGTFLKAEGYKVLKGKHLAERKHENGWEGLFFDIDKQYDFTYSISVKLRIRNNEIQKTKTAIDDFYGDDDPSLLNSVHTLAKVLNKPDINFEKSHPLIDFSDPSSIESWMSDFSNFMNEVGFTFLNRFQSIENFDEWFNTPVLDGSYDFDTGLNWNDSVSGLIAAKFVNNPDYEAIYSIWVKELTRLGNQQVLDELKKMKEYLDSERQV